MADQPAKDSASIPIEEIASFPLPGMAVPGSLGFSPDGRLITYLHSREHTLVRQLFAFDLQIGAHRLLVEPPGGSDSEENVSLEEALRRERQRQRELGVTQYAWAKHVPRLLVPSQGEVYVSDAPGQPLRRLVDASAGPALDPQLSPDGNWVAYVQDAEVVCYTLCRRRAAPAH